MNTTTMRCRSYMNSHLNSLGLLHHRITAMRWSDIDIPEDVAKPEKCNLQTSQRIPNSLENIEDGEK